MIFDENYLQNEIISIIVEFFENFLLNCEL